MTHTNENFPCPSCGFLTFSGPPGTYEICELCGWEDDPVQLRHPLLAGGANRKSLLESQQEAMKNFPVEVSEHGGIRRDLGWQPLRSENVTDRTAAPRTGTEYFEEAADDSPPCYWRRQT